MDDDFQARYVATRAITVQDEFEAIKAITSELMAELDPLLEEPFRKDAALAWQAFVFARDPIQPMAYKISRSSSILQPGVNAINPIDTLQELSGAFRLRI